MICEVIQRSVSASLIGLYQYGMRSCLYGSISFGTRSKNQPTLSMFSSSMGTRHSKWPPEQAGLSLHGIRFDTHAVLKVSLWIRDLLAGLLQALAGVIPHPAVVVAAQ